MISSHKLLPKTIFFFFKIFILSHIYFFPRSLIIAFVLVTLGCVFAQVDISAQQIMHLFQTFNFHSEKIDRFGGCDIFLVQLTDFFLAAMNYRFFADNIVVLN